MNEYTKDDAFADFNFFLDQCNMLYDKYGEKYVVICNQQVLGVFDTEDEANQFTLSERLSGKCIVQQCFKFPFII